METRKNFLVRTFCTRKFGSLVDLLDPFTNQKLSPDSMDKAVWFAKIGYTNDAEI